MRRHTFDAVSFVLGALFAAIGIAFLFGNVDLGDLHLAGIWPLPLILIGVLMLVSTIQRRSRPEPVPAAPPGAPASTTAYAPVRAAATDAPRGASGTAGIEPADTTAEIGGLESDHAPTGAIDDTGGIDQHDANRHDTGEDDDLLPDR